MREGREGRIREQVKKKEGKGGEERREEEETEGREG